MDFREAPLGIWAQRIAEGALTAEALMVATLDRIDKLNPALNAFTELRPRDDLLEAARAVDRARGRGERLPPLAGMP
ncbi:MAG: AtzE family amidohydrolase, partial [Proteobacteria bacterium]|nr:AtzE family amidohydrolase [Pseudomonadota bacterium]